MHRTDVVAASKIPDLGLTYEDRFKQPRVRPEVAIERDGRIAFARLVRELRLDVDPDDDRIPTLPGGRRHA